MPGPRSSPLMVMAVVAFGATTGANDENVARSNEYVRIELDEKLRAYEKKADASGTLVVQGSDVFYNAIRLLAEEFREFRSGWAPIAPESATRSSTRPTACAPSR